MPRIAPASSSTIPHVSGGVGYDERTRLEAVKSQYNLRLLFAISGAGSYLSTNIGSSPAFEPNSSM